MMEDSHDTDAWMLAQDAARQVAGGQHYPAGSLYMVATPIGNLADISLRALQVLQRVEAIACEDSRHSGQLLRACGLDGKPLLAVHEHNENQAAQTVIARLQAGQRVAYVSDAGTPSVSDPGARLAAACQAAGLRVVPIPGASSVAALLSVAGAVGDGRFVFEGFLPARGRERAARLQLLQQEPRAIVLLEAPHRIAALARALKGFGLRPVTLGRELTKRFEQVVTLGCAELADWLALDAQHQRGEFTLLLHPFAPSSGHDDQRLLGLLLAELPLKTAVRLAAEISGQPRNDLYAQALALQKSPEGRDGQT